MSDVSKDRDEKMAIVGILVHVVFLVHEVKLRERVKQKDAYRQLAIENEGRDTDRERRESEGEERKKRKRRKTTNLDQIRERSVGREDVVDRFESDESEGSGEVERRGGEQTIRIKPNRERRARFRSLVLLFKPLLRPPFLLAKLP